jgi:hypothetical protein
MRWTPTRDDRLASLLQFWYSLKPVQSDFLLGNATQVLNTTQTTTPTVLFNATMDASNQTNQRMVSASLSSPDPLASSAPAEMQSDLLPLVICFVFSLLATVLLMIHSRLESRRSNRREEATDLLSD